MQKFVIFVILSLKKLVYLNVGSKLQDWVETNDQVALGDVNSFFKNSGRHDHVDLFLFEIFYRLVQFLRFLASSVQLIVKL